MFVYFDLLGKLLFPYYKQAAILQLTIVVEGQHIDRFTHIILKFGVQIPDLNAGFKKSNLSKFE